MSVDLGDRTEDSLIYFMWSTNAADGSSITRAVDGTISVYKNDDLTQSVAGITDTEDFDSLTGIHLCKIDTSADAFYAVAEDYTVVLSGATIDGKSVNAVLAVFSIENRFMRGTESAALAATALTDVIWTDAKAGTLTDWINGGRLDVILDLCAVEATLEGHVNTCLSAYNGPTDTEMIAAFTEIKGATWAPGTDTLEHIRDRGDSTWATATGFATSGALTTAQNDLNTLTGADGATLATTQANYAPNIVVPDAAGTLASYDPPTRAEATTDKDAIITEVNANETKIDIIDGVVDSILVDTGATIPGTIATLQTDSTGIKAKTDALPSGIAKNVALPGFNVFMVLASDDKTAATGKTVTCTISKDGGAFGSSANSVTEISSGMYKIDLTQAEMNYDVVTLRFTATDCNDRILTIYTS